MIAKNKKILIAMSRQKDSLLSSFAGQAGGSKKQQKILVAMSGGVDSSVAAALLVEKGCDVTGAFMKQISASSVEPWTESKELNGVCSWKEDRRDALRVAAKLDIPLITLDFEKEYKEWVMDYMFKEYEAGRTPNPDVLCNKYIKFGVWLDKARKLGFDKLATGHYSNIKTLKHKNIKTYHLMQAKDLDKDQTYFLHQLSQAQLQHVMFPIGEYTKLEVRDLAKKFDLPTANRKESMGICFIGEVPMKEFLQQKIERKPGKIVMVETQDVASVQIGEHEGLAFYTIGQRQLGIMNYELRIKGEDSKPIYVVDKNFDTNELVVGFGDDSLLYKSKIAVKDVNWISGHEPEFPLQCKVRLRHRQVLQDCRIMKDKLGIEVDFENPQRAVTPGQFAVFYKGGKCLGGGIIEG